MIIIVSRLNNKLLNIKMNINEKLKQRKMKIMLEKKHFKNKVFKKYKNELKSDGSKSNFNELVNKYNKTEQLVNNNDTKTINEGSISNNTFRKKGIKESNEKNNKDNSQSNSLNIQNNPIINKNKESKFKSNNIEINKNFEKNKKFSSKEEFINKKRRDYKKLNMKYKNGQPILNNKIEYLYKKILDKRNFSKQ